MPSRFDALALAIASPPQLILESHKGNSKLSLTCFALADECDLTGCERKAEKIYPFRVD